MIHESYGLLPYKEILFSTMSKEGEKNKEEKKTHREYIFHGQLTTNWMSLKFI